MSTEKYREKSWVKKRALALFTRTNSKLFNNNSTTASGLVVCGGSRSLVQNVN